MAQQKFTATFREALRCAHNERCIYCKRDLRFIDTKIDHVLPESCLKEQDQGKALKEGFGLPDTFDIKGYENLAPCCEECNGRKSNLLLQTGYIVIVLANIRKKLPELERRLAGEAAKAKLDYILRAVALGIEQHSFSKEQLLKGIDTVLSIELLSDAKIDAHDEEFFANGEGGLDMFNMARHALYTRPEWVPPLSAVFGQSINIKKIQNGAGYFQLRTKGGSVIDFAIHEKYLLLMNVYRGDHGQA